MSTTPRTPPAWLVDGIGRMRDALNLVSRSAVALFEMTQGAWRTQALADATLGIAALGYVNLLSCKCFRHTHVISTAGPRSLFEAGPA